MQTGQRGEGVNIERRWRMRVEKKHTHKERERKDKKGWWQRLRGKAGEGKVLGGEGERERAM